MLRTGKKHPLASTLELPTDYGPYIFSKQAGQVGQATRCILFLASNECEFTRGRPGRLFSCHLHNAEGAPDYITGDTGTW